VRAALKALPWVEQDSVRTDVSKREVRFGLRDKKDFDFEQVKEALARKGYKEVELVAGPT